MSLDGKTPFEHWCRRPGTRCDRSSFSHSALFSASRVNVAKVKRYIILSMLCPLSALASTSFLLKFPSPSSLSAANSYVTDILAI